MIVSRRHGAVPMFPIPDIRQKYGSMRKRKTLSVWIWPSQAIPLALRRLRGKSVNRSHSVLPIGYGWGKQISVRKDIVNSISFYIRHAWLQDCSCIPAFAAFKSWDCVRSTAAEQRVWLYVKSTVTTQSNVSVLPPTALLSQLVPCAQGQERKPPIASLTDTREGKPLVVGSRARKQKRVRFTDIKLKATQAVSATQDSDVIPADTGAAENMSSISPSNLRELQDICRHLSKATPSSEQDCQGTCLGYLETQNSCRLLFYNAAKVRAKSSIQSLYDKETVLLSKVVQQLSIFHQLEVAHKLAIALLQYHATSWLADSWRLQDLSFFAYQERGVKQMLEDLKTLHLSVQFPEACPSHIQLREDADSNRMESTIPVIRDKSTEQDICIPLISLGVALLEIGLGRDLQEEKQGLEPDKLTIARRMVASNDTRLGPKYQSVIRACLQCKFGFGFDLGTEELQDAVYSQVICQLEDMIRDVKSVLWVGLYNISSLHIGIKGSCQAYTAGDWLNMSWFW